MDGYQSRERMGMNRRGTVIGRRVEESFFLFCSMCGLHLHGMVWRHFNDTRSRALFY
jgi:hypothetical protein